MKHIALDRVVTHLEKTLTIFHILPQVKVGEVPDFGGLWGALHYTKSLG
jgi:hypothetical protein